MVFYKRYIFLYRETLFLVSLSKAYILLRVLLSSHDQCLLHATRPEDQGSRSSGARWSSKALVGCSSVAQLRDMAVSQLPKRCQRLCTIRKQVESARIISSDNNLATLHQMVHPVGFHPECRGNLRHRARAGDAPGSRPPIAMQTPVPQANSLDRTGEHTRPLGRAKPLQR